MISKLWFRKQGKLLSTWYKMCGLEEFKGQLKGIFCAQMWNDAAC